MVEVLKKASESKTLRDLLVERNIRVHLYADSAEGLRSTMDRDIASAPGRKRKRRALARLPVGEGE